VKTIPYKKILPLFLTVFVLAFSGCGAKVDVTVHEDLSVDKNSRYYLTREEVSRLTKQLDGEPAKEPFESVVINGEQYYKVMQDSEHYRANHTEEIFSELNKKYAVVTSSELEEMWQSQGENSPFAEKRSEINFADASVTFPYPVYETNGKVREDGRTVDFNLLRVKRGKPLYAVFDESVCRVDGVDILGVRNNKIYNQHKEAYIRTSGVIKKVTVTENGSDVWKTNMAVSTDGYKNWYFATDGEYHMKVQLISGKTTRVKFTIDTTAPQTNVKSKTYKNKVKVTYFDKTSGIQSATLNGKTIKSGMVVKRPGKYKLVLTDKAGNVKKVVFHVK